MAIEEGKLWLALRMSMSRTQVERWLSGATAPPAGTFRNVLRILLNERDTLAARVAELEAALRRVDDESDGGDLFGALDDARALLSKGGPKEPRAARRGDQ